MSKEVLDFTIFCIESLSNKLNISTREVYKLLTKDTDVLEKYIVECYEPLHTQSEQYIVNDIIEVLKIRGALK